MVMCKPKGVTLAVALKLEVPLYVCISETSQKCRSSWFWVYSKECICVLESFFKFCLTYCIYSNMGTTTLWEATNCITARILCAKNVPTICLWGCVWEKAKNSEIFHIDSWLPKCYFSLLDHRMWHTRDLFLYHILTVVCQRSLSYF